MFNHKIKILLGVSLMVLGGVIAGNAQLVDGAAIRFEVSHPFVVRDKTLPAGKYSIITVPMGGSSTNLLEVVSQDGKDHAIFSTLEKLHGERAKNTELVFSQADGTYFLSEIRMEGDDTGAVVEKTRSEKRVLAEAAVD